MPQKGSHNVKGHLYIKFNVKLPTADELNDPVIKRLGDLLPDEKKDEDVPMADKAPKKEKKTRGDGEGGEEEEEYSDDDEPLELHEHAEPVEGEPNVTPASSKSAYDEDDEPEGQRCRTM